MSHITQTSNRIIIYTRKNEYCLTLLFIDRMPISFKGYNGLQIALSDQFQ